MKRIDRLLYRARHELTRESVPAFDWAGGIIKAFGLNPEKYATEDGYDLRRALEDATGGGGGRNE